MNNRGWAKTVYASSKKSQIHSHRIHHELKMKPWFLLAQNITTISAWLRQLNFRSYSMYVLRQMPPLPAVTQPPNGHSLAFFIVAGKLVVPDSSLQPECIMIM